MRIIKILMILCFSVCFSFCKHGESDVKIALGKRAPEYTISLLNGGTINSTDLKGEYVLIDFWASWCGPCLKEIPSLIKLSETFKNKKLDNGRYLKIITVALEKKEGASSRVSERYGFGWDLQSEEATRFVRFSAIASKFEVRDIPSTFLISPKGTFLSINRPYLEIEKLLHNRLQ